MARTDRTIIATFYGADRHGTSVNGNPTWSLRTSEGVMRTQSDASLGYAIGNYIGRGDDALIGKRVVFTATRAGRVWNMRPVRHGEDTEELTTVGTCVECERPVRRANVGGFRYLVTADDDDRACYGDRLPVSKVGRVGHRAES